MFQRNPICRLHRLQAHLSHAIAMSQLIYHTKITCEATQPHTPQVFHSTESNPRRALIAPRCCCHMPCVGKQSPQLQYQTDLCTDERDPKESSAMLICSGSLALISNKGTGVEPGQKEQHCTAFCHTVDETQAVHRRLEELIPHL